MPSYLARTGLAVFGVLLAITLLTERTVEAHALVAMPTTVAVAGVAAGPAQPPLEAAMSGPALAAPALVVAPEPAAPAIVPAAAPNGALVLASWYGPGFYGNRTACGQTYTPEILGVAHLTLPCGTPLTLTYGVRSIVVTVIDRGPYVAGRTLDLSNATKLALACTDLCTLRMQLGQ